MTETRGSATDTYSYLPSATGGRSPVLSQVQPAGGVARTYQFGSAGHLERVTQGVDSTLYLSNAAGRLSSLTRSGSGVIFRYDGRDFLSIADAEALPLSDSFESGNICAWSGAVGLLTIPDCPPPKPAVHPTYNSEGLLHALSRNVAPERSLVFHFAGRPVAQLDLAAGIESWKYLTTDHLGTPIAATSPGGALLWQGGFEPFGADWSGAAAARVFLRFPGQWEEETWTDAGLGMFYNLHRFYEPQTGRYTRPDPIAWNLGVRLYRYAHSNPLHWTDRWGLSEENTADAGEALAHTFMQDLDCIRRIRDEVRQAGTGKTRYQHCLGNCRITKECPSNAAAAWFSSMWKEFADLRKCIAKGSQSACDSAFQGTDFVDNKVGRDCPIVIPCTQHCRPLLNRESELKPGPFEGLYPTPRLP